MVPINEHYLKLRASYLFSDIAKRVLAFQQAHPDQPLVKLGIGDVTRALPPACVSAFHRAVDEMANEDTFRGYGPEQGYPFLREAIAEHDYGARGATIAADEVFVSDGSKCDTGNIQEIFGAGARIAIPDPVYPVYVDTNVMAGRTGSFVDGSYQGIRYLPCTKENGFIPAIPDEPVDVVYLCFPNNPTGATAPRERLADWVSYAKQHGSVILYDAAYEAYIRDPTLPRTIYEIPGAREVAIEFRSFSKTAGFTGTRCAFTVVPKDLLGVDGSGQRHSVHQLWHRRHTTKFNGVSYPVQAAAAAIYTPEGKTQVRERVDQYMKNARRIREAMTTLGFDCVGGDNSPYIWVECRMDSWAFFDLLLERAHVVCTPGSGFGHAGAGYIRLSAFNSEANVEEAIARISRAL